MSGNERFTRAGDSWEERSTTDGPEWPPCPDCGAQWNPVFVAFARRHPADCPYVARVQEGNDPNALLVRFAEGLPTWEEAGPDEELTGYISGVTDALRIVRGQQPESDPRRAFVDDDGS